MALWKVHMFATPFLQGCLRYSTNFDPRPVKHRLFLTSRGGLSAASFLHVSFLQAIRVMVFWPVYVNTFLTKYIQLNYIPSGLGCQFLSVAQFVEKSTAKSVFLWYRSQSDHITYLNLE